MIDFDTLKAWAYELGFAKAGMCSAREFALEKQIVSRQKELKERRQLRFDPCEDEARFKSLAVLLWAYDPTPAVSDEYVWIDNYYEASNMAYHAARKLEQRLIHAGCFASANVSYPAKSAAVRAGLGVIGQNSLLITPEYGSRVVIILVATDIACEAEDQTGVPHPGCLRCGRCAAVCPAGALDDAGMTHPQRCLRNYMMEGIVVPQKLRTHMRQKLIGCDACQRICPMQPHSDEKKNAGRFKVSDFVSEDDALFSANLNDLAQLIGRNTARPQRVRAQAALLAGCSGNPAFLPVLKKWACSSFDAVREHALWAIKTLEEEK